MPEAPHFLFEHDESEGGRNGIPLPSLLFLFDRRVRKDLNPNKIWRKKKKLLSGFNFSEYAYSSLVHKQYTQTVKYLSYFIVNNGQQYRRGTFAGTSIEKNY